MSAATSEWPGWLRRRTAVELLGPPGRFFAWLTIALSLLTLVYVGAWNAAKYPIPIGYDAQAHVEYAHVVIHDHRLPRPDETAESNQPPAYYVVAGAAAALGKAVFGWHETRPYTQLPDTSYRGAQILNVVLMVLSALCVLWLAWVLAPRSPWVWAASVGFFCLLPVVDKTMAMFHPENLNLLTTAAAIASVTHMLVRRTFRRRLVMLAGISLGLGFATRASSVFTLIAIVVGVALTLWREPDLRARVPWRAVRIAVVVAVLAVVPWIAFRAIVHHAGPLNATTKVITTALHPSTANSDPLADHSLFFRETTQVFTAPWRTHYYNYAFPETYTEIWGDWIGSFAWSSYSIVPWGPTQRVLKDQSWIGVLPTVLSIAGWLAVSWVAFRRRPELVAFALLPVLSVGGYLYRAWVLLTRDGDLLKAVYALTSVPVWAVSFGLASAYIASRSRLARYGMVVLFTIFAVLELRFVLYGIRDHRPVF